MIEGVSPKDFEDFRAQLKQILLGKNHTEEHSDIEEQIEYGGRLWEALSKESRQNPDIANIIAQRVKIEFYVSTVDEHKELTESIETHLWGNKAERIKKTFQTLLHHMMNLGKKANIIFNQVTQIGKGTFGTVYKVDELVIDELKETDLDLIMKLPINDPFAKDEIRSEITFIHELYKRLEPEERNTVFSYIHPISYEGQDGYVTGHYSCDLDYYLKNENPSLEEKIQIATKLIEQMAILSKHNVIYTDIKTANVLVKKGEPIKVVLADFGNCHFVDKRDEIPSYGFNNSPSLTCIEDDKSLFTSWENLSHEELKQSTDQHESRALALLLCVLFSGEDVVINKNSNLTYQLDQLKDYIHSSDPLKSLKDEHKELYDVIHQMLGIKQKPIPPKEAWRSWNRQAADDIN